MRYRIWQVFLVASLSCALGVNYTLYTWLDYEMLGISKGKMAVGLYVWGCLLLVLGLLLLITLVARKMINVKMMDKQAEVVMAVVFVLQLPMISLWFMAIFMQGIEAVYGVLLHHILLGLALYSFLSNQYKLDSQQSDANKIDESF